MKIHELVEKSIEWVAYDGVLGTEPYALQQYLAKSDPSIDDDFFAYVYTLLVQHPSIRVSISQEPLAAQDKSVRLGTAPLPEGYEPPASIRQDVDITQMYQQGVKGRALAYHLFGQEFKSSKEMIKEKREETKQKVAKYKETKNKKSAKKGKKQVDEDSEVLIRDIGAEDGAGTARSDLPGLAEVWGSRLRLRCTDDEIYFRLVGTHTKNPKITSAVLQTLQHSVKSRERGITTVELGPLIGTSQGSMHHYMKTLTGLGLCAKVPAILHAAITNLLVFHKFLDQNVNYLAHTRQDPQPEPEVAPVAPELDSIDADDERADNDTTVAIGPATAGDWGLNFAPLTEAQLMSGLTVRERMVKLLDHPGLTNHLLRAKNLLPLLGWIGEHELRHRRAVPRALRGMILDDIIEYVEVGQNKVKCLRLTRYNPEYVPRAKPTLPDDLSLVTHTLEDLLRQHSLPHAIAGGVSPLQSIPYQIVTAIMRSGNEGLIITDISIELFNLFRRFIEFFFVRLERQTKPPPHLQHMGYSTLLESYGKERRLRAFGRSAYRKVVQQSGETVDESLHPPIPPEGGHFADVSFRYYYNSRKAYNNALDKLDVSYSGPVWSGVVSAPARPPPSPSPAQTAATPETRAPKRPLSPEAPSRGNTPELPASPSPDPDDQQQKRPVGRPPGSAKLGPKKTKYETLQVRGRPRKYIHVVTVDGKVERAIIGHIVPRPELSPIYVWLPERRQLVPAPAYYTGLGPPPPLDPEALAMGQPPEYFDQFPQGDGSKVSLKRRNAVFDSGTPRPKKSKRGEPRTEIAPAPSAVPVHDQDTDSPRRSQRARPSGPTVQPDEHESDELDDDEDDVKTEQPVATDNSAPSSHASRVVTPVSAIAPRDGLTMVNTAQQASSAAPSPGPSRLANRMVRVDSWSPSMVPSPARSQHVAQSSPPVDPQSNPQSVITQFPVGSPFTSTPLYWNRDAQDTPAVNPRQTQILNDAVQSSDATPSSSPLRHEIPRAVAQPDAVASPQQMASAASPSDHAPADMLPLGETPLPQDLAHPARPSHGSMKSPGTAAIAPIQSVAARNVHSAAPATPQSSTGPSSPTSQTPQTPLFLPGEEEETTSVTPGTHVKDHTHPAKEAKRLVPIRPAQATRKGGRVDLGAVRRAHELTAVLQAEGGVSEEYGLWKKHREWSHRVAGTDAPHAPLKGATMDRSVWKRLFDTLKADGRIDYTTATVPNANATWSKNKVLWLVDTPREVVQAYMRDLANTTKILTAPKDITTPRTHIPHMSYTEVRLPNLHASSSVQTEPVRDIDLKSRKLAGDARRDELLKDPLILSQLHGRQSGKFSRTKTLHLAIRAALDNPNSQSVLSASFGAFVASLLSDDIAAGAFYSIVLTHERDEDLIAWLANPVNHETRLRDLPFAVRINGRNRRQRARLRVKAHFDMLTAMGVISPLLLCAPEEADVSVDTAEFPDTHLKIAARSSAPEQLRTLVMHDYAPVYHVADPSCRLIGYLPVRTAADIEAYWEAYETASLEYDISSLTRLLATPPTGVRNVAKANDTLQVTDTWKSSMRHSSRWRSELRLLPVQRDALNEVIDTNLGICKLKTPAEIEAFAWEYALPLQVVQDQLSGRLERAQTKARERREAAERRIEAHRARQAKAQQALARKLAERQAASKRAWETRVANACAKVGAQYSEQLLTFVSRQGLTALTRGSLTDAKIEEIIRYHMSSRYQEAQQREAQRTAPARRKVQDAEASASPQHAASSVEPDLMHDGGAEGVPPMVLQVPTRKDTRKRAPKPMHPREKPFRMPGKRYRRHWTAEDHELIVDAEAIIRCRNRDIIGNSGRYAMEQLFPGCLPVTFLSRLRKAIDTPEKESYLDLLERAWMKVWVDLRGTEELPDPIPESNVDFDLRLHIDVLRRKVNKNSLRAQAASMAPGEKMEAVKQPELPFQMDELFEAYNWVYLPKPHIGFDFLWQAQYSQEWSLGQFGSISPVSHDEQADIKPDMSDSQSRGRLRAIIKMIVATPAGQYDQVAAIKLLKDYDQPSMVNPEINAMVNEKILVRHASASLTGRFFSFAQSWQIAAQGPFAGDFHDEASSMNEKLDQPGGYELPLISPNGGDIAALMSMISDHQVDIGFDINKAPTVAAGQGILNTRKLSDISFEFEITAKRTRSPAKRDDLPSLTDCPAPRQWSAQIDDSLNKWVPVVHERVRQAGAAGLSKSELKTMLSLSDQDLSTALAAVSAVTTPQVFWAGYDTARLVSIAHWRDWLCPAISLVLDEGKVVEGGGAEIMCTPRRWVDIWGRRIDEAWKQAVDCAKGWIMSRPGMTEHLLRERLDFVMDRLETNDVLQYLVDQGSVERLWRSSTCVDIMSPIEATDTEEEKDIVWRVVPAKLYA